VPLLFHCVVAGCGGRAASTANLGLIQNRSLTSASLFAILLLATEVVASKRAYFIEVPPQGSGNRVMAVGGVTAVPVPPEF
jgi:hypothetical protein